MCSHAKPQKKKKEEPFPHSVKKLHTFLMKPLADVPPQNEGLNEERERCGVQEMGDRPWRRTAGSREARTWHRRGAQDRKGSNKWWAV